MIYPEAYGGFDFGIKGLAGCMEEFGRTLLASPILSSVVLSGSAILNAGCESQNQELLPAIAAGEKIVALALEEAPRHAPAGVALKADKNSSVYLLNGHKTLVMDGHVADSLLLVARNRRCRRHQSVACER